MYWNLTTTIGSNLFTKSAILTCRPVHGRMPLLVHPVRVGAVLEQEAGDGLVPGDHGHMERGEAVGVVLVEQRGVRGQYELGARKAAGLGAVVQGSLAGSVADARGERLERGQKIGVMEPRST